MNENTEMDAQFSLISKCEIKIHYVSVTCRLYFLWLVNHDADSEAHERFTELWKVNIGAYLGE